MGFTSTTTGRIGNEPVVRNVFPLFPSRELQQEGLGAPDPSVEPPPAAHVALIMLRRKARRRAAAEPLQETTTFVVIAVQPASRPASTCPRSRPPGTWLDVR